MGIHSFFFVFWIQSGFAICIRKQNKNQSIDFERVICIVYAEARTRLYTIYSLNGYFLSFTCSATGQPLQVNIDQLTVLGCSFFCCCCNIKLYRLNFLRLPHIALKSRWK